MIREVPAYKPYKKLIHISDEDVSTLIRMYEFALRNAYDTFSEELYEDLKAKRQQIAEESQREPRNA